VSETDKPSAGTMCKGVHSILHRKEGPRIPRRYGTGPTMVCGICGAWTPDWGGPSNWRPADTLAAAMEEDDGR
jgi:hypothetical protein